MAIEPTHRAAADPDRPARGGRPGQHPVNTSATEAEAEVDIYAASSGDAAGADEEDSLIAPTWDDTFAPTGDEIEVGGLDDGSLRLSTFGCGTKESSSRFSQVFA